MDAQDWGVEKVISLGNSPRRAVLTPNGRELYVSNYGDGTVSVVDTAASEVKSTLRVGESPGTMVASDNGSRVYVLIQNGLAIIDTADKSHIQHISIPDRTDEMALSRDGKRLYLARVYEGVYELDTASGVLSDHAVIETRCPVGIAISKDQKFLYVNYQCGGPGGSTAHDAFGVYALPSFAPVATLTGLANVGDQVAVSADGSQIWMAGVDACARPDYPHENCPGVPSRVVNVLRAADFQTFDHFRQFDCANPASPCPPLVRSFGFSLEDFNGRISLSPDGKAFIGGGINLKEIDIRYAATVAMDQFPRLPIADVGDIAFQADGKTAYVTLIDKNAVAVINLAPAAQDDAAAKDFVSSITPASAAQILGINGNCSQTGSGICYRVVPEVLAAELHARGFTGQTTPPDLGDDPYCSTAEQVIYADPWQAIQLIDLQSIQQYLDFNRANEPAGPNAQQFTDVTRRLLNTLSIQTYLDNSSVALYTIACKSSYHTVFIQHSGPPVIWPPRNSPQPPVPLPALQGEVANFLKDLNEPCSDSEHLKQEAQTLYNTVIGDPASPGSLAPKLERARAAAPEGKLTVVWVLRDTLRYIPMAALFDGHRYMAEEYSSAVLLREPAARPTELKAVVAGVPSAVVGFSMKQDLEDIFAEAGAPADPNKIPATFLLDSNFTPQSLSHALQQDFPIIHIASHFVLSPNDATASYLLTGSGPLPVSELQKVDPVTHKSAFPFHSGLLTLEACSSATYGDGRDREGFGYIASENGAGSVVASLWDVQYGSANELMQRFYDNLRHNMSRSQALQTAELDLLRGAATPGAPPPGAATGCATNYPESFQHPNFWAPFVLMGSWK